MKGNSQKMMELQRTFKKTNKKTPKTQQKNPPQIPVLYFTVIDGLNFFFLIMLVGICTNENITHPKTFLFLALI